MCWVLGEGFCLHGFYSLRGRGICSLFESFRMMDLIPLSVQFIIIPTHIETFSLQRILVIILLGGM